MLLGANIPRGACRVCRQDVSLRNDGTLRGHGFSTIDPTRPWCAGSGLYPRGVEPELMPPPPVHEVKVRVDQPTRTSGVSHMHAPPHEPEREPEVDAVQWAINYEPTMLHIRRGVFSWWYSRNYRGRVANDTRIHVRVERPLEPYGQATGINAKKVHLVRDVLVGRDTVTGLEQRLTRFRCGACTWTARTLDRTTSLCARCDLARSGTSTVREG